jgi:hypothetical protein
VKFLFTIVIFHIIHASMNDTEKLRADMEAAAIVLGIAASSIGEKAGQGGQFYGRVKRGCRVWPETAARVRGKIAALKSELPVGSCDLSHGNDRQAFQGEVGETLPLSQT